MTDSGLPKRNIYHIISVCFSILILLFLLNFGLITPRIVMIVGMLSLLFFAITLSIKECRNWIGKFIKEERESYIVLYGVILCIFISLATYLSFSHIKAQTRHIELVKSEVNRLAKTGDSHFENKEYDLAKDNYLEALEKARELPAEYMKEFLTNINNGLKEVDLKKEELASIRTAEERRRQEEETKQGQIVWNKCVDAVIALKTYRRKECLKMDGGETWIYLESDDQNKRSYTWMGPRNGPPLGEGCIIEENEYIRTAPSVDWKLSKKRPKGLEISEIWKSSGKIEEICGAFKPTNITLSNTKGMFEGHECYLLQFSDKSEVGESHITLWIDKVNYLPCKRIIEGKIKEFPDFIKEALYYDFDKPLDLPDRPEEIEKWVATIKIEADDLYAAYEENEVAADEKYKGKILYVTGVVKDIGKDILGTIYVTLETYEIFGSIQCMFSDAYKNEIAQLSKGNAITIKGRCKGKSLFSVLLHECSIIK